MKLILSTVAAIAMLAIPATAMTADDAARMQIQKLARGADVSTLTEAQIASLRNTIHSSDHASDAKRTVASLLRRWQ